MYRFLVVVTAFVLGACASNQSRCANYYSRKPLSTQAHMNQLMPSKIVTVSIQATPATVYSFASDPANLPQWAPGFAKSVAFSGGEWVVQTADGPMVIRFVTKNELGVLDHIVTLASGIEIYNPMRVIPNGTGSEVVFTLFQTPGMSEEKLAEDAKLVESDLQKLKKVIESHRA